MSLSNPITCIKYKHLKIYISESPNQMTLSYFIDYISKNQIKHIVRLCESKYQSNLFSNVGFYDWQIIDGSEPSDEIISNWNNLVKLNEPILVHCLAGLGRAPTLVAIALIENQMEPIDAINLIRNKRKGTFNSKQIDFVCNYKKSKSKTKSTKSTCNIL
jgi:protein tyrosine phosphatase type 4A